MATYDEQIITILAKAGERGMSVKKISMQLYNLNCTLFVTPDFKEIYQYTQQFLLRNSKTPQSLFRKEERGIYMLNPYSARAQQLVLNFMENEYTDKSQDDQPKDSHHDLSLSLFDKFF